MGEFAYQERRHHHRYQTRSDVYAAFMPRSTKRGQIIDISMSGLAFHYIADRKRSGERRLSLIVPGEGLFLNDLHCSQISDILVSNTGLFTAAPIRRCSVAFQNLKPEQASLVALFINRYALEAAV